MKSKSNNLTSKGNSPVNVTGMLKKQILKAKAEIAVGLGLMGDIDKIASKIED